jgi:dipeptidyl aminopeptidase/acylaminoacyl peptidase
MPSVRTVRSLVLAALVAFAPIACAPASPATSPIGATAASTLTPPAEGPSGYDRPPQNILDVLHAPSPPVPYLSPTNEAMLLVSWEDYPPMARVATPFLRLAGVRVEPRNHSRHDTPGGYGITPCATGYVLAQTRPHGGPGDRPDVRIALPANGCPGGPAFTADGKRFAFRNITTDSVELWIGDATSGEVHRVPGVRLNPMLGDAAAWMPDQRTLLVKLVPEGLGAPPPAPIVPSGPSIQETDGKKGESSTYETRDTLTSKHDEALFDHFAASQLALVDAASGSVGRVGAAGAYDHVAAAPDGEHILVTKVQRPYSYVTTYDRFPHDVEVWNRRGAVVRTVAKLPLHDRVPVHGVPVGPRFFRWRATEPATLVWAEALDGGDWKVTVPARDRVMLQKAPFTAPATEVTRTEQRFEGFDWGERPGTAILYEHDENRHWFRGFVMDVDHADDPASKPRLLWDLSTDEHYQHPGAPVHRVLPNGEMVMRQEGDAIFLAGDGSSPDGDRPFLDRTDLRTKKTERLFRSDKAAYDRFLAFVGADTKSFVTWHESKVDPPNAFARTLGAAIAGAPEGEAAFASTAAAITHIPDPTPAVRGIKKQLVKYKRKDGLDLSFTLYLPPDYKEGTRLPTVLYAYPLDFADASKAAQVTGSQQKFTRLRKYKLLLLAGYAIIDDASFPIVGDPKKAYDTYLEQLVDDATAAVEKATSLGVVDPDRIGVTGHSHGALMTVNLVAHSDLFRAGVATSGSYNKTLTPFGFQSERRSVWEATPVYLKVSPFFSAATIKTPLLIVHGEDDANPGTTPLQAEKLYEAIRGNGGTTRLVMLPHEPHWYSSMESNEQLAYEMVRWFDRYVKNAPPRAKP